MQYSGQGLNLISFITLFLKSRVRCPVGHVEPDVLLLVLKLENSEEEKENNFQVSPWESANSPHRIANVQCQGTAYSKF